MWQRVFALVIKEFLAILKDRRERIIIIVPPLFQLFLFSYAATFDLNHVPLAIYNQDNGTIAQRLISDFIGSKHFERVAMRRNSHGLKKLIDDQKALIILSIGTLFRQCAAYPVFGRRCMGRHFAEHLGLGLDGFALPRHGAP